MVSTPVSATASKEIVVDRGTVLNFMQYRAKAFEPGLFEKRLNGMSAEDRKAVIDDYVREEVLYREALSLGLEEGDYIIRQRLIQKLKFLIEDTVANPGEPARGALGKFYAEHKQDYTEPPIYTFTQVFFDAKQRTDARAAAQEHLVLLNRTHASLNDAGRYGDRPLYFQNYVERTRDFVVSHFGESMIGKLDSIKPSETEWRGPFESPYGWHLVLLTKRTEARLPDLNEVSAHVLDDYKRAHMDQGRQAAIDRLSKGYSVKVGDLSVGSAAQRLEIPEEPRD